MMISSIIGITYQNLIHLDLRENQANKRIQELTLWHQLDFPYYQVSGGMIVEMSAHTLNKNPRLFQLTKTFYPRDRNYHLEDQDKKK